MNTRIHFPVIFCLMVAWVTAALPTEAASKKTYPAQKIIPGFSSPESVLLHRKDVYVSNVGRKLEPLTKDGDGFISKLNAQGVIQTLNYFPLAGTLHAPKGMAILGNVLYVADIDRVVGFSLDRRETVFTLTVPGTSFLNDCTAKDEHTLLLSCTDSNRIVAVDVKAKTTHALTTQGILAGPNGVVFNAATQMLYVVGMGTQNQPNGEVGRVDLAHQGTYTRLCSHKGLLDGLVRLDDGSLLFSDWIATGPKGKIYRWDAQTQTLTTLPLPPLSGPADFAYHPAKHQLWIPEMSANQVRVYTLTE